MDNHIQCLICGTVHSFKSKTVNCWKAVLFTLCRASTCRSWKSEVSSLMAWLARMTDKTPNPWCLEKIKSVKCHWQKVPPVFSCNFMASINTKPYLQKLLFSCQTHPLPGPSFGDPAPSLVRAAISRTRRAARGSFSFPLSASAVGLRFRIRYRLFRRHQAPSNWKFW